MPRIGFPIGRARPAMLTAAAVGVAMAVALLDWHGGSGPRVSAGLTPSPAPSVFVSPPASASPPTGATPVPAASPTAPNQILVLPAALRTNVPLPAGAQIDTTRLVADSDWLVMGVTFGDSPTTEALYAANLHTGALHKIRGASVFSSVPVDITVAGSRAAWAEWTCESSWPSPMPTEQAHPLPQVRCSGWRVVLTDLDTGAGRVAAQGTKPDVINDPQAQDIAVPAVPAVALGDDALAYTTGDLTHGVQLNLLTLASGETRTLPLAGPPRMIRWAGQDLAWLEDTNLQAAGTGPDAGAYNNAYYLDSKLMVLSIGTAAPRQIAEGAYWLDADVGEIAWDTGGNEIWTVPSPYWQAAPIGYESNFRPFISEGWLGWAGTWRETPFLVVGPRDATPRVVPEGLALSGGWLVLGSRPGQPAAYLTSPTTLAVVRLSDLEDRPAAVAPHRPSAQGQ